MFSVRVRSSLPLVSLSALLKAPVWTGGAGTETIRHLGSSCGPHKRIQRATFGPRALSLIQVFLLLFLCFLTFSDGHGWGEWPEPGLYMAWTWKTVVSENVCVILSFKCTDKQVSASEEQHLSSSDWTWSVNVARGSFGGGEIKAMEIDYEQQW